MIKRVQVLPANAFRYLLFAPVDHAQTKLYAEFEQVFGVLARHHQMRRIQLARNLPIVSLCPGRAFLGAHPVPNFESVALLFGEQLTEFLGRYNLQLVCTVASAAAWESPIFR
ncbi:hypothetical protein D3C86_1519120 [compost metagenome]